ncbi:hypothetical protein B0T20DRAFT_1596 [Sordaria brevicollis]|uniref:Uncharacterized protein n=1 Tax=Sordaria brevicollis TaxID=83679 RepID=A0AAE0PM15_SORBR|nr:hypothetical protein B0T20DRAFT_1596 [Sordaria brevicollis]
MPPSLLPRWHMASRQLTHSTTTILRPSITTATPLTTARLFSSTLPRPSTHHPSHPSQVLVDLNHQIPKPPPKKWITDLPSRVGKCIIFGCSPAQISAVDKSSQIK